MDGLYVRLREGAFLGFLSTGLGSELWMTGVTLQGNGDGECDCSSCGVYAEGHVYAEGARLHVGCNIYRTVF